MPLLRSLIPVVSAVLQTCRPSGAVPVGRRRCRTSGACLSGDVQGFQETFHGRWNSPRCPMLCPAAIRWRAPPNRPPQPAHFVDVAGAIFGTRLSGASGVGLGSVDDDEVVSSFFSSAFGSSFRSSCRGLSSGSTVYFGTI